MRIESLEIHTEIFGGRVRFHKLDLSNAEKVREELYSIAKPYTIGAPQLGAGIHDRIRKEIEAKIEKHNDAEAVLESLRNNLRIVELQKAQPDLLHNPYLQAIAIKNKQTVKEFVKGASRRILKEIRTAYKAVLDTNSVLSPVSLQENHNVPDALKKEDIDSAIKAGQI